MTHLLASTFQNGHSVQASTHFFHALFIFEILGFYDLPSFKVVEKKCPKYACRFMLVHISVLGMHANKHIFAFVSHLHIQT